MGNQGPGISSRTTEPATPPANSAKQPFPTRAGIVVADCERIISMAPAQGYAVHEQDDREGEFRGVRDNHDRVKVELSCPNGTPQLRIRDDD